MLQSCMFQLVDPFSSIIQVWEFQNFYLSHFITLVNFSPMITISLVLMAIHIVLLILDQLYLTTFAILKVAIYLLLLFLILTQFLFFIYQSPFSLIISIQVITLNLITVYLLFPFFLLIFLIAYIYHILIFS